MCRLALSGYSDITTTGESCKHRLYRINTELEGTNKSTAGVVLMVVRGVGVGMRLLGLWISISST